MGAESNIEWLRHPETNAPGASWNPLRGCRPISPGCKNCYAADIGTRFCGEGQPFRGFANARGWTGITRWVPEHADDPIRWQKDRRIFICSASDLCAEDVPDEAIWAVLARVVCSPRHTHLALTKRPGRLREILHGGLPAFRQGIIDGASIDRFTDESGVDAGASHPTFGEGVRDQGKCAKLLKTSPIEFPIQNLWVGATVEGPDEVWRADVLKSIPAVKRFISIEPMLARIDPAQVLGTGIHWIIIGGESGPRARPFSLNWAREWISACREAGIPIFVKQLGDEPFERDRKTGAVLTPSFGRKGGTFSKWPRDLQVREQP